MVKQLINYLYKPFKDTFVLFLSIVFLLSFPDAWFYYKAYKAITYSIYIILQATIVSYVICLLLSLVSNKTIFNILKFIVLFFCYILFVFDFVCVFQHDVRFNADFLSLMLETNIKETKEFFLTFATDNNIKYYLCIIILFAIVFGGNIHYKKLPNIFGQLGLVIIGCCCVLCYHNKSVWKDGFLHKLKSIYSYQKIDLTDYLTHPDINYIPDKRPANIVLIIGESLSKFHCSLYGYHLQTNPLLETLTDSSLYVFNNVSSAAIHTQKSFKYMMSTYSVEDEGKSEWFAHITLPEIINLAGYKTHWLSNQARGGNSTINSYVNLFHDFFYNGDQYSGDERKTFDGDLIKIASSVLKENKDSLNFYVFHLMGSHFQFHLRYPKEFEKFTTGNYINEKENQRERLATYDNSVLYNDYVVYHIMNLFKNKEAIILYLSDHGLDVFYTDDNYAAHAKMNNPESIKYGVAIPFMIYTSSLYNQKYPEKIKAIKSSLNQKYRTDSLIYTIMDIAGILKINDKNILSKSILNEKSQNND